MVDWSEVGIKVLCYVSMGFNSLVIEGNKQLKFSNKRVNKIIRINSLNAKVAIETSHLVCRANQLTGFYMMATLAFNVLMLITLVVKVVSCKNTALYLCKAGGNFITLDLI